LAAASLNFSLKPPNDPKFFSIRVSSSPVG
jgi:hypothetical protein